MTKQVGVVLVHYSQRADDTLACLDSLCQIESKHKVNFYVVYHSASVGLEAISSHGTKPQVIQSDTNLGFAGHNNLGIQRAIADGCEVVILLNNDTTVDPDFIDPLVKTLGIESVGLVSPKIYFAPGCEYHHDSYDQTERGTVIWYGGGVIDWENVYAFHKQVDEVDMGQAENETNTLFCTGCCIAFRKDLIDSVGLMPEGYFLYLEDVSWSLMAVKAGYELRYVPTSKVWHKNASSTQGTGSKIHTYYQTRNRILFAKTYAPWRARLAVVREAIRNTRNQDYAIRIGAIHGLLGKDGYFTIS